MQLDKDSNSQIQKSFIQLINTIVTDLRQMGTIVKSSSKIAYQANNSVINQLLLANSKDAEEMIQKILTHLMQIVEFKGVGKVHLAILSKLISLIKIIYLHENNKNMKEEKVERDLNIFVKQIVDLIFVLNNKYVEDDMILRIVQTLYSIIEPHLLQNTDYQLITRIYSILLKCCRSKPLIQNISVSAIFTLTQIISTCCRIQQKIKLLIEILQFTIGSGKCQWIQDFQLRSITWDIILIIIKSNPSNEWDQMGRSKSLIELLNQMYKLSMQNSFPKNVHTLPHNIFQNTVRLQSQKTQGKKDLMWDYVKCYKVFIYFSIFLSVKLKQCAQIVPFRKNIGIFHMLYDYQRTNRFYIVLQGISLIIKHGSIIVMEEDSGIMMIDIFQKICQDLYAAKKPYQITWDKGELRLQKIYDDFSKITDEDYLRLTKNTLINLRKGIQSSGALSQFQFSQENIQVTMNSLLQTRIDSKQTSAGYRWRRLIKSVIRIIRYLTSLKFKQGSNDQALRKFIMQLQSWFILCPTNKTKNAILYELQSITNNIDTINQAIKASQCMQICSNILYGFYDQLNSVGISIVVRILANIKICFQSGKDFNQLDQVSSMADKFYIQQKLICNSQEFKITVEGFVQSINLIMADMLVPTDSNGNKGKENKNTEKYLKIIEYILLKLKFVISQNEQYFQSLWTFIQCFWISLCSNKQQGIRTKISIHVHQVLNMLLKSEMLTQQQIIHFYLTLSKFEMQDVSRNIIQQIKQLLSIIKQQQTIIVVLNILTELRKKKYKNLILKDLEEIQEIVVKEYLFRIKKYQNVGYIIDFLEFQGKGKNQEYSTVSLLWNISDHLKSLYQENKQQKPEVWLKFFLKINHFAKITSYPGTRQSCIHTFTQTIATCIEPIGSQLYLKLLTNQYIDIFGILMGFNEEAPVLQPGYQVQMCKMGIKSFIKLTKKCITNKDKQVSIIFSKSIENLIDFMEKKGGQLPIEYFIQLLDFFEYFKELKQEDKKEMPQEQKLFELPNFTKVFETIESKHQYLDKSNFYWKKKYEPVFTELKKTLIDE